MAGSLEGRRAIVTGAGQGLGAAHARALASEGCKVIVNDLASPDQNAERLVAEICEQGGIATVDHSDVSDFEAARRLVDRCVHEFGGLDILVNNAGILRDRMLVKMAESDWDDVLRVHLKGHFAMTRHAAAYWKDRASSRLSDAVVIHTTSVSGLHGNIGQTSYAVAKAGIATLARVNHLELNARLGVRTYAIAPGARTRMTTSVPEVAKALEAPEDGSFDYFDPDNVAAFVAWLAKADCPAASGSVFGIQGDIVRRYDSWQIATTVSNNAKRWTNEALDEVAGRLNEGAGSAFMSMEDGLART